jgi:hypothetical protein
MAKTDGKHQEGLVARARGKMKKYKYIIFSPGGKDSYANKPPKDGRFYCEIGKWLAIIATKQRISEQCMGSFEYCPGPCG